MIQFAQARPNLSVTASNRFGCDKKGGPECAVAAALKAKETPDPERLAHYQGFMKDTFTRTQDTLALAVIMGIEKAEQGNHGHNSQHIRAAIELGKVSPAVAAFNQIILANMGKEPAKEAEKLALRHAMYSHVVAKAPEIVEFAGKKLDFAA